jgi:hypothetical protein
LEALAEYDFTVQYRPGVKHGNADGMSRLEYSPQTTPVCLEDLELPCIYCPKCTKIMALRCEQILCQIGQVTTRQSSPITSDTSNIDLEQVMGTPWTGGYSFKELEERQIADPDISIILQWRQERDIRPEAQLVLDKSPNIRN